MALALLVGLFGVLLTIQWERLWLAGIWGISEITGGNAVNRCNVDLMS